MWFRVSPQIFLGLQRLPLPTAVPQARDSTEDMIGKLRDEPMADMSGQLKTLEGLGEIAATMRAIGAGARAAARTLATIPPSQKERALRAMAARIKAATPAILA